LIKIITNTTDLAAIKILKLDSNDIIGFSLENIPTKADYIFLNNVLTDYIANRDAIRLLLQMEDSFQVAPKHVFEELQTTFDFYKNKTNVAVLGKSAIIKQIDKEAVTSAGIRLNCFALEENSQAIV